MNRLTLPWRIALASLALVVATATLTLWALPAGKLNAQASQTLNELLDTYLGELDQRLFAMDTSGQAPDTCEFTWHDQKRVGLRTYTFEATFQRADYDPIRQDWVITCSPDAEFYALDIISTYTGAYAPNRHQLVMHRITDLPGTAGTR